MNPDAVLEGLIAAGAFAIAADRYEEETGDAELAALMRIPGLEWELVDAKPALKLEVTFLPTIPGPGIWFLNCGSHYFGATADEPNEPAPIDGSPVSDILTQAGLGSDLAPRFYQLYREAVERVCVL